MPNQVSFETLASSCLRPEHIPQPKVRQIGIEFELESSEPFQPMAPETKKLWRAVGEPSLRNWGNEYVVKLPCSYSKFKSTVLPSLLDHLAPNKKNLLFTGRTSTHIHINFQHERLVTALLVGHLYLLFEDFVGEAVLAEDRRDNLFCIGGDSLSTALCDYLLKDGKRRLFDVDQAKYSAVNFSALAKYGSLEFRLGS